jgi:hypothetical protein
MLLAMGLVLLGVGCGGMGWMIERLKARVAHLEWQLATPCRICHPTVPQFPPVADAHADVDLTC